MGDRLVTAFPKTRAAAGYAARHGPGELARARATSCWPGWTPAKTSCLAVTATCPPSCATCSAACSATWYWPPGTWPARPGSPPLATTPDIAAFTALQAAPVPAAPAELDEIISRVPSHGRSSNPETYGHLRECRQQHAVRADKDLL